MKKILLILLFFAFLFPTFANAQNSLNQKQEYHKAKVTRVIREGDRNVQNFKNFFQFIEVQFLEGPKKGEKITLEHGGSIKTVEQKSLKANDEIIILSVTNSNGSITHSVWDKFRLNYIYYVVIGFFVLVVIFAGIKGFGSLIGMAISLFVLLAFIVPQILDGRDPLLISIIGSLIILLTTIYLSHGVSKKTTVAVVSTFASLVLTGVFSYLFVKGFNLSGLGDENSYMLQVGSREINPQGLLLGGIIIGALGVLDDITTTQSAAIHELAKLDKMLSITDLFVKGYNIGREHIVALVNTLILAYAGASLSLFVIFVLNPANTPTWVILNSEMVSEEIVRAIAGSIGLVLAVPITTIISAWAFTRARK